MSVEIKFQQDTPESKPVKTYTGNPSKWPNGVYANGMGKYVEFAIKDNDSFVAFNDRGTLIDGYEIGYDFSIGWTRISDDPRIASITFAGSMNYPDGKPEGGEL